MTSKFIFVWLLAIICYSCDGDKVASEKLKSVDLGDLNEASISDVFELCDAIALRDGQEPFLSGLSDISRSGDYFVAVDGNCVVYLFDLNGKMVSSSARVRGHGHGEYYHLLAYAFNPFSQRVEIATPTKLLFYDTDFNFEKEVPLPTRLPKEGDDRCLFNHIYDLDEHLHALLPSTASYNKHSIVFFGSDKQEIVKAIDFSDDLIGYVNMQSSCFTALGDSIVFYPAGISKHISCLDKDDLSLRKVVEITGVQHKKFDNEDDYSQYAMQSANLMPLRFIATGDCSCFIAKEGNSLSDMSLIVIAEGEPTQKVKLKSGDRLQFPLMCFSDQDYVYGLSDCYGLGDYFESMGLEMPDSLEGCDNIVLRYKHMSPEAL